LIYVREKSGSSAIEEISCGSKYVRIQKNSFRAIGLQIETHPKNRPKKLMEMFFEQPTEIRKGVSNRPSKLRKKQSSVLRQSVTQVEKYMPFL